MQTTETLYVVTCVFNPLGWKSRIDLYKKFERYMEQCGVVLITTEIALKQRPFEVTKPYNKNHVQLRSDSIMWFKECGLNAGIKHVKEIYPEAKKIAWIDADVTFSNPNWVQDTLLGLDNYDVLQLFSHSQSLDPNNNMQWQNNSIFYKFIHSISYSQKPAKPLSHVYGGHPGLAWASTMEKLDALGGLMDFCVHGSADTHMAFALMGEPKYDAHIEKGVLTPNDYTSQGYKDAISAWKTRCDEVIKKNIGYINGICFHYWHGRSQVRGYKKRYSLIQFHKFDPYVDLVRDDNGLYKWTGNKPDFVNDLRLSLMERNEDGNEA